MFFFISAHVDSSLLQFKMSVYNLRIVVKSSGLNCVARTVHVAVDAKRDSVELIVEVVRFPVKILNIRVNSEKCTCIVLIDKLELTVSTFI